MAAGPECLILDEPTTGLDRIAAGAVDSMIGSLGRNNSAGMTLIVVSHDMKATLTIADRVLFLYNGCVRCDAASSDFAGAGKSDPVIAQFLSGAAAGPITAGMTSNAAIKNPGVNDG